MSETGVYNENENCVCLFFRVQTHLLDRLTYYCLNSCTRGLYEELSALINIHAKALKSFVLFRVST